MNLVSRLLGSLVQDQAKLEAEELSHGCRRPGSQPIAEIQEREIAQVTGAVHSIAVQPGDAAPQLSVELYDGTGVLRLIWLGRRRIHGIRPGAFLTVRGRVAVVHDQPTMFNPSYVLLPGHD